MSADYGKAFEKKLKEDFMKMEGARIWRLYDPMGGYTLSNISDFIGYKYPYGYLLECKSHKGNSFPLTNLTQYDKLVKEKNVKGLFAGVIIWFYEKDKVVCVPIETVEEFVNEGKKSISLKDIDRYIEVPSVKKRVFMDSDYSVIAKYIEERDQRLNDQNI